MKNKPLSDEEFKNKFEVVGKIMEFICKDVIPSQLMNIPDIIFENEKITALKLDSKAASTISLALMLEVMGRANTISMRFLDISDEVLHTPKSVNNPVRDLMNKMLDEFFDDMNLLRRASQGENLTAEEKKKYQAMIRG